MGEVSKKAQEYLDVSERVGACAWVLDHNLNILRQNPSARKLTSGTDHRKWQDIVRPGGTDIAAIRLECIETYAEGHICEFIAEVVTGTAVSAFLKCRAFRDGDGSELIILGFDITELQRTKEMATDFARFPLENPNPVLRVDAAGDILLANDAAQDLMGQLALRGAEDRAKWKSLMDCAREAKDDTSLELTFGEETLSFSVCPVRGREYTNIYGANITETAMLRRQLLDITSDVPAALFQYLRFPNGSDQVIFVNDQCEEIWGITAEELGSDASLLWQIVEPDDLAGLAESVERSGDRFREWSHEWRVTTTKGDRKWLRGTGTPHLRSDGGIIWNSVVIDVTELRESQKAVSEALNKTINVLSAALEKRDPYTAGHEARVAKISHQIGEKMGLDVHQLTGLELAATVHDVGKIKIPAEILSKPTKLSHAEFELIKEHPQAGAELLQDIAFEWPIADIVCQHHERIDGSGYPKGLKGDEILLEARIIAVADTFEAMVGHRPYRPGLGIDIAAQEIRDGAGSRYDPAVAKACLELVESKEILKSLAQE